MNIISFEPVTTYRVIATCPECMGKRCEVCNETGKQVLDRSIAATKTRTKPNGSVNPSSGRPVVQDSSSPVVLQESQQVGPS